MAPLFKLTVLVSVLCIAGTANVPDPSGWENVFAANKTQVMPLHYYGDKVYYLGFHIRATYMLAMQFCSNIHMKLLSIRSEKENDQIYKFTRDAGKLGGYWTSGAKILDDRTWIWLAYGQPVEYTKWGQNQPDSAKDKCLQVYNNANNLFWNDLNCDAQNYFICERYQPKIYTNYLSNRDKTWDNLMSKSSISANIGLLHFGSKKYYFAKYISGSFMQAIEFCKIINMQLVSVTSPEENEQLSKHIRDTNSGNSWWSSGSRLLDGKNWAWFTKGTTIGYTNWAANEPNSRDQMCLKLVHSNENGLKWADEYCSAPNRFICESNDEDDIDYDSYNPNIVYRNARYPPIEPRFNNRVAITHGPSSSTPKTDDEWEQPLKDDSHVFVYRYHAGMKYHLETQNPGTQQQAARFCEFHNMQLLEVKDNAKNANLEWLLLDTNVSGPYWIAANKIGGTWAWPRSSEKVSYTNWAVGKPSNEGSNDCVQVDEMGFWSDANCNTILYFICEVQMSRQNPVPPTPKVPSGQCPEPVVNVYINTNLVSDKQSDSLSNHVLSSKNTKLSDSGYQVLVNNQIDLDTKAASGSGSASTNSIDYSGGLPGLGDLR